MKILASQQILTPDGGVDHRRGASGAGHCASDRRSVADSPLCRFVSNTKLLLFKYDPDLDNGSLGRQTGALRRAATSRPST